MRDYGKVYSTFWSSATTGDLSDTAKLLALYLMTCPHATIAGVFRLPDGYVAEDLRWSIERVQQGFVELSDKGFADRCQTTKWVWIRRHLEWNPPENPNQRKSAVKIAVSVPDSCAWKQAFMRASAEVLAIELPPEPNPSTTVAKGSANQEQEQEQEQEQKAGTGVGLAANGSPSPAPSPAPASADATAPTKRGTRLPSDWAFPKAWGQWAQAKYPHWTTEQILEIALSFRNHWVAVPGKDGLKLDWEATWQKWCGSHITQKQYPAPKAAVTADAQAASSRAKGERILAAMQAGGGAVARAADPNTIDMPT